MCNMILFVHLLNKKMLSADKVTMTIRAVFQKLKFFISYCNNIHTFKFTLTVDN